MDFTIVAPCFNEEENIPELVFLFRNEMRGQFVSRLIKYSKKNKNLLCIIESFFDVCRI